MALIAFGGGVTGASGSVAGNTFSRGKGGAVLRQRVKGTNPSTIYQEEARDRLTQYTTEWRGLTDDQRANWNAYAATHPTINRLGASTLLTGAQQYTSVNTNRDIAGDDTANDEVPSEPVWVPNIIDTAVAITADVSASEIFVPLGAGAADGQIVFLYMTGAISPGVTNFTTKERLVGAYEIQAADVTATKFNAFTLWTARFGALTGNVGRAIKAHIYQYDQGATGAASQVSGQIVA